MQTITYTQPMLHSLHTHAGSAYERRTRAEYWTLVSRTDGRARALADKHYSRKTPGAAEFCPPGDNIVLVHLVNEGRNADALWVSHRPNPFANLKRPRFDGMDYWDNPYFRNETKIRSSDLIKEAVSITVGFWGTHLPKHGFHSFVDPKHIEKPVMRYGKPFYGYCFHAAGFRLHSQITKSKKLQRFVLPMAKLWEFPVLKPHIEQLPLFEVAA